ncbi:MAG: GyrI-like domain-containing protein [Campylobacteraceae bacterium]|nr:GyrI-like domain-containing protein [Campylobacteraceae bacterium]
MKKDTKKQRAEIINNSLYYIYKYIDTNITLDELARLNSVSKYHFHRIFKEETNENLFSRITAIRLQKAANLLITNNHTSISEIANMCGYSSHSSFIKAFKNRFLFTPTKWRNGSYKEFSNNNLNIKNIDLKEFENIKIEIKVSEEKNYAYIRHKGYNPQIKHTWQRLLAYAYEENIQDIVQIGIHHDNPLITKSEDCQYIAGIEVDKNILATKSFSILRVPKSLCAVFSYKGTYGDVLKLMNYIYNYWLPNSYYESKTLPSYAIYHKNHFLNDEEEFDLDFYVPISTI